MAWGDGYWEKVCNDPANKSLFPDMARGLSFYAYYSDPKHNTEAFGWHQIGRCLSWAGQLYSFVGKTGAAAYDELKDDGKGNITHDTTSAAYYQTLKPKLAAGAAIMLSTRLTGGHIILLVGVDDDGITVNDPYGTKLGGPASTNAGYILNGHAAKTADITDNGKNIAVRFKHNPKLLGIAGDETARKTPQLDWGERNFFTFDEVDTYDIGKWNSVLDKAPAAG
jgi:hypothetical protein